jgi:rSAM/selenodomain-associated transferase 1
MENNLLIVFVKNGGPGKVKTRLAKTIGDENAFIIYQQLVEITKDAACNLKQIDVHVYFSENIEENDFNFATTFVQQGNDLGAKMKNAINNGLSIGYKKVVLIGSDLPDMSSSIIDESMEHLNNHDIVFGPAKDGGYYLVGMNKMYSTIFENKPWSTNELLKITINELSDKKIHLLKTLNDIDDYDDLINL